MTIENQYLSDVEAILSHRHDNGADLWATPDKKLFFVYVLIMVVVLSRNVDLKYMRRRQRRCYRLMLWRVYYFYDKPYSKHGRTKVPQKSNQGNTGYFGIHIGCTKEA